MSEEHGGFLVTKDGAQHLPTMKNGKRDPRLMGAAWAALHGGYRGNKYDGPDRDAALKKLKKMYKEAGLETPTEASEPSQAVIHCREEAAVIEANEKWEVDKPVTFEWMPGGVTTINAHYEGRPIQMTVQCDESTAAVVQASYDEWFDLRPKGTPFGCVEHREEEAAIRLPPGYGHFDWDAERNRVTCTALPTELGAKNVNGRIHSAWSPSFTTDADFSKAQEVDGRLIFARGARGSRENPARVTGVAFSVGSLTNKPAFRNISPVRAKEADSTDEGTVTDSESVIQAKWSDEARTAALAARRLHHQPTGDIEQHRSEAHYHAEAARRSDDAHYASEAAERSSLHAGHASEIAERTKRASDHRHAAHAHAHAMDAHRHAGAAHSDADREKHHGESVGYHKIERDSHIAHAKLLDNKSSGAMAAVHSNRASQLSGNAMLTGNHVDYQAAADAHRQAAKSHRMASKADGIDDLRRKSHEETADRHDKDADHHDKVAANLKKIAATESPKEGEAAAVQASDADPIKSIYERHEQQQKAVSEIYDRLHPVKASDPSKPRTLDEIYAAQAQTAPAGRN